VYEAPALWYDDALINKELGFASMRRNIDLPTVDPFAYLHDPSFILNLRTLMTFANVMVMFWYIVALFPFKMAYCAPRLVAPMTLEYVSENSIYPSYD